MSRPDRHNKQLLANTAFSAGSFKQPIFGADGTTCIGVETVDGTKYYADKVVLAAGAWSPTLVDLEDQCCSKVRLSFSPVVVYDDLTKSRRLGCMHTSS